MISGSASKNCSRENYLFIHNIKQFENDILGKW